MEKLLLKEKTINKYTYLISALVYSAAGVCLIIKDARLLRLIPFILIAVLLYNAARAAFSLVLHREEKSSLADILVNLGGAVLIFFRPVVLEVFLSWVMGAWGLLMALIRFVVAAQYHQNRISGVGSNLLRALVYLAVGGSLILSPIYHFRHVIFFIGCYFLFYAAVQLINFIFELVPQRTKDRVKRRIRIPLPTIISALIPISFLNALNERLKTVDREEEQSLLSAQKSDTPIDLEVFVHVSDVFPGQMGHVDICFGDQVMSYGNYDEDSYYLFGVAGDGVMEVIDRRPYINFWISYSKKTIVGFGLTLTEAQKESIRTRVNEIFADLIPWEPIAKRLSRSMVRSAKYAKDYASELYNATGAKFYKFTKGKYKSYFGFNTNCVRLADDVLRSLGIETFNINGIITPGTYYEYFNEEFKKTNSIVITRRIYNREM